MGQELLDQPELRALLRIAGRLLLRLAGDDGQVGAPRNFAPSAAPAQPGVGGRMPAAPGASRSYETISQRITRIVGDAQSIPSEYLLACVYRTTPCAARRSQVTQLGMHMRRLGFAKTRIRRPEGSTYVYERHPTELAPAGGTVERGPAKA